MTPEERKLYHRAYYLKNREKLLKRCKKFYDENREKIKEYQKAYHKKYYQENKTKLSKIAKENYRLKKYPHLG